MKKLSIQSLSILVVSIVTMILFQNCSRTNFLKNQSLSPVDETSSVGGTDVNVNNPPDVVAEPAPEPEPDRLGCPKTYVGQNFWGSERVDATTVSCLYARAVTNLECSDVSIDPGNSANVFTSGTVGVWCQKRITDSNGTLSFSVRRINLVKSTQISGSIPESKCPATYLKSPFSTESLNEFGETVCSYKLSMSRSGCFQIGGSPFLTSDRTHYTCRHYLDNSKQVVLDTE